MTENHLGNEQTRKKKRKMCNFVDVKRNLISSFFSLHNTPCSLDLVNIPARIRGECIDTFNLSCGFLDFFFDFVFKGELVLADRSPPPPLEWISSPPLVAAVLITTSSEVTWALLGFH